MKRVVSLIAVFVVTLLLCLVVGCTNEEFSKCKDDTYKIAEQQKKQQNKGYYIQADTINGHTYLIIRIYGFRERSGSIVHDESCPCKVKP